MDASPFAAFLAALNASAPAPTGADALRACFVDPDGFMPGTLKSEYTELIGAAMGKRPAGTIAHTLKDSVWAHVSVIAIAARDARDITVPDGLEAAITSAFPEPIQPANGS